MKETFHAVVSGALRNCIHDHGPITDYWIGSATKRILCQLEGAGELRNNAKRKVRQLRRQRGKAINETNVMRQKVKECLAVHSDLYQEGEECSCCLCDVLREALDPNLLAKFGSILAGSGGNEP